MVAGKPRIDVDASRQPLSVQEIHRLELNRLRASSTFRLGTLFTRAFQSPLRLFILPFSILMLLIRTHFISDSSKFLDTSGKKLQAEVSSGVVMISGKGCNSNPLMTARSIAISLRKRDPHLDVVLLTTENPLHLLQSDGFPVYHLPDPEELPSMPSPVWSSMMKENLTRIIESHQPSEILLIGDPPQEGLIEILGEISGIRKSWFPLELAEGFDHSSYAEVFDRVVIDHPSEQFGLDANLYTSTVEIDPVLLLDPEDDYPSREAVRSRLGISGETTAVLIDTSIEYMDLNREWLDVLVNKLEEKAVQVVWGRRFLDRHVAFPESMNTRVIEGDPMVFYLDGFDYMIVDSSTNLLDDMTAFSLPGVCLPRGDSDQRVTSRMKAALECGFIHQMEGFEAATCEDIVDLLTDDDRRREMMDSVLSLLKPNGAGQLSRLILDGVDGE